MSGDTIVAIATALGPAGVGVLRVSGPAAVDSVGALFKAADGRSLRDLPPRYLAFGRLFRPSGGPLDEVMVVRFHAPNSFTGEDVVEIQAHGGAFHLAELQAVLLESWSGSSLVLRPARPGEFTQRAFLNGKMDLTRAEAVADLIHSDTALAREAAAHQLAGGLRDAIVGLRKTVLGLLAECEAACDFPEEQEQLPDGTDFRRRLDLAVVGLDCLLGTARVGRLVSRGLRVALAGAPNAGKSSLLNALCGEDRAIVGDEPGTTRDWLEARVQLKGLAVAFYDTAGLHQGQGSVEVEGVRRAFALAGQSDLLLLVLDSAAPLCLDFLSALPHEPEALLCVLNKSDLASAWSVDDLGAALGGLWEGAWDDPSTVLNRFIRVSALTKSGIDDLLERIFDVAIQGDRLDLSRQIVLTQARHERAARDARVALCRACASLDEQAGPELLAVDLRMGLDFLGEIVGATARAEVVDEIFRRFCIGK